jgi:hypothetical protein
MTEKFTFTPAGSSPRTLGLCPNNAPAASLINSQPAHTVKIKSLGLFVHVAIMLETTRPRGHVINWARCATLVQQHTPEIPLFLTHFSEEQRDF